ncbi:MAG: thioesterase family protein [Bacteroidales bacterium]|jgi:predicted thioesterase|nr:thioesterase family protein [Bacteroidales bacterium]
MENKIPVNIIGLLKEQVTYERTAAFFGSGLVEVYATPAMISFMEKTCLQSVLPYLSEGYNTVGTEVHVKHLKATSVGQWVECKSQLISSLGRKLEFEVEVFDDEGLVGKGTHKRYIIDVRQFMENRK